MRSRGRVVDRARLESVYRATYRGFESLRLRQLSLSFTFILPHNCRGREALQAFKCSRPAKLDRIVLRQGQHISPESGSWRPIGFRRLAKQTNAHRPILPRACPSRSKWNISQFRRTAAARRPVPVLFPACAKLVKSTTILNSNENHLH